MHRESQAEDVVKTKILPAQTFPGQQDRSAFDDACKWLESQCEGGFLPVELVAKGSKARVSLSGPEGGCIVFVKK